MSSKRYAVVVLSLISSACAAPGADEPRGQDEPRAPSAFLGDVESRVLTSAISGRDYMVSIALPWGYADSTKQYPVLYALDANGQFGTVVEAARILQVGGSQIPQLVIVGIGYPSGGWQMNAEPYRIIDFFPTLPPAWIDAAKEGWPGPLPSYDKGGAVEFLRFIREELIPLVESQYRVDPSDRALYGHSGGGWFGLYALFNGEGTFQRVIAGSPSLWWDDRLMFEIEREYAARHTDLLAKVFFSVGLEEFDDLRPGLRSGRMVSNLEQFVDTISAREYQGLVWFHQVFAGENHQSVIAPTVSRGLRYIYGSFP